MFKCANNEATSLTILAEFILDKPETLISSTRSSLVCFNVSLCWSYKVVSNKKKTKENKDEHEMEKGRFAS